MAARPRREKQAARVDDRAVHRSRWRQNTIVGMLLAFSGVVGLWGIGFFSFDLLRARCSTRPSARRVSPAARSRARRRSGSASPRCCRTRRLLRHLRLHAVTAIHRPAEGVRISFVAAMCATAFTFWYLERLQRDLLDDPADGLLPALPVRRLRDLLPELFPTRLRSTGTSFCYNVGRFVAAVGPLALGLLTSRVYAGYA